MYEEQLDSVIAEFREWGIHFAPTNFAVGNTVLSFTTLEDDIQLGLLTRAGHILRIRDIGWSIAHEIAHNLVVRRRPNKKLRKFFGHEEEWNAAQSILDSWRTYDGEEHITRYAASHPEEDLCECVAALITGTCTSEFPGIQMKLEAAADWLRLVGKRRNTRA